MVEMLARHSWKAKVSERAIEGKGCKVCEKDYLTVFPKLAVMYYAAMKHIKVQTDIDKIIGIPLEMYLPEEKVAIETVSQTENVETLKAYLCRKREIKLIKIPYTLGSGEVDFAVKIKKAFRSLHIFITSNEDEDTAFIRQRFLNGEKYRKNKGDGLMKDRQFHIYLDDEEYRQVLQALIALKII